MKPLFWFNALKGVVAAILVMLALVCLFAFIGLRSDDPAKFVSVYASVALFVASAIGGALSSRGADKGSISALICGLICSVLVLIPSLIFSEWGAYSLIRLVATVVAALIGAFLFGRKQKDTAKKQSIKRRKEIAKKYGGM